MITLVTINSGEDNMEYSANTSARVFRARRFTENCCKFETPEGRHIPIDPILLKTKAAPTPDA